MKHIWAPWRVAYIRSPKPQGCIFCDKPKDSDDEANYILFRGKYNLIMMNSYPYNPGHLMVIPYRHLSNLEDMNDIEMLEHLQLTGTCIQILKKVYSPNGFNTGMNLGKIAGAGIDDHIHTHIVPRWQGDTNFMPVVGDVRVISEALVDTYKRLKLEF